MYGTSFENLPRLGQRRRSESVGTCGRAVQIAHGAMFLGWEAGIPPGPLVVLDYQGRHPGYQPPALRCVIDVAQCSYGDVGREVGP